MQKYLRKTFNFLALPVTGPYRYGREAAEFAMSAKNATQKSDKIANALACATTTCYAGLRAMLTVMTAAIAMTNPVAAGAVYLGLCTIIHQVGKNLSEAQKRNVNVRTDTTNRIHTPR